MRWPAAFLLVPLLFSSAPLPAQETTSQSGAAVIAPAPAVPEPEPPREFTGDAFMEMESEVPLLGDTVRYHVKLTLDEGWELQVPGNLNFSEGFRPLKEEVSLRRRESEGAVEWELSIPFVLLRVGRLKIPARQFEATGPGGETGIVSAGRIIVNTGSHYASENEPAPDAPLGPVVLRERNWLLIWAAVILGIIALAVLATTLVLSRLKPRGEKPGPPPPPPHEKALAALSQLVLEELDKKGEFALYYTRLSLILRDYLGGRWSFDSLDMTTTELLRQMKGVKLEHFLFEKFSILLHEFDLVKFAKAIPSRTQAGEDMERVREIVRTTTAGISPRPSLPEGGTQ